MLHENLITLTDAANRLPGRPHTSTLWRWARKGCKGVKLGHVRIGGRVFTSEEAIHRFTEQLTEQDDRTDDPPAKPRSSRQRDAAIDRAERDLEQGGW